MSHTKRSSLQSSTGIRLPVKFMLVAASLLVASEVRGVAADKCKSKGKGKGVSSESSVQGVPKDSEYGGIATADSSPDSSSNGTSIESYQCFCPCSCAAPRQPPRNPPSNPQPPPRNTGPAPDNQAGNSGYCERVSSWNSDDFEAQMLRLTNQARSQGRSCGHYGYFPAAKPLRANKKLKCSARNHSEDMARKNYFAHNQPGTGEGGGAREKKAGYEWRSWGENIAGGWDSPMTTYTKWLNSPPHCSNLMKADFTELGVGYLAVPSSINSQYNNYWTQNFGKQ